MRFQELLARLPADAVEATAVSDRGASFDVAPQEVPGFVEPTLSVVNWPENAAVLLVEAAGAVGKSATAQMLAKRLKWPLVRSEHAQVGSYSLSGVIQSALGFGGDHIRAISAGESGVVVDSLDEAHSRAGSENFFAYIDNIMEITGRPDDTLSHRNVSIVILSRSDTAELVRLAFVDRDIPLAHMRIDFFDHDQACAFITSYLSQRHAERPEADYDVAIRNPGPFGELRDKRLADVASILLRHKVDNARTEWAAVSDFLGYAPVLIAIAESLAVSNPSAESGWHTADDPSQLLASIVKHILDREQGKLGSQIRLKLVSHLPAEDEHPIDVNDLYSPLEQILRLLCYTTPNQLATPMPASLPRTVRHIYDESVTNFLPDHPFLRGRSFASQVFRDYAFAVSCVNPIARPSLKVKPEKVIRGCGPFFARFLIAQEPGAASIVNEDVVEQVISSWNQEVDLMRPETSQALLTLAEDYSHLSFSSTGLDRADDDMEFVVDDVSGAFQVNSGLRRTMIVSDQALILGRPASELQIGPNVILVANEIDCLVETLRIESGPGALPSVGISADSLTANRLAKVEAAPASLRVYVDDPPPRLRPFIDHLATDGHEVAFDHYVDLRAILTSFRNTIHQGLSVRVEKINRILGNNGSRSVILDRLVKIGAVKQSQSYYVLDPKALAEHGFGLPDLKSGHPSDAIVAFLAGCNLAVD